MTKVLIEKDVAEAIEHLQKKFAKRVIFRNKGKLDERLNQIDSWTLAVALIEGYEVTEKIVIDFVD
ncbi:MAG TPA: hypothetical protein VI423_07755 [Paenisporosarcina sp.]|nr:hypothetical protein [Paenisporosarcina sp.]